MKVGILYITLASVVVIGIIYIVFFEWPPIGFGGIGRLIVGGIISLWLLQSGIARIRVARAKELLGKLGIDLETEEKGS